MKNIVFVCHGNICRSPAAEFIFKKAIKERGLESEFNVSSFALSNEEIGNDIYYPMKDELRRQGIPFTRRNAKRLTQEDYEDADVIFYMDSSNKRILDFYINDHKHILHLISEFSKDIPYVEDPWYTDRYTLVVNQLTQCVNDILDNLNKLF